MKRFKRQPIRAAVDDIDMETIHNGAFSDLAYEAGKLGYKLTITDDYKMTITCEEEKDIMPEIKVNTVEEKGTYYFNPDLKFPELKYDDMDYADSVHYIIDDKWNPLAKFITKLNKFGYSPRDYGEADE